MFNEARGFCYFRLYISDRAIGQPGKRLVGPINMEIHDYAAQVKNQILYSTVDQDDRFNLINVIMWALLGSNQRPADYESAALTI